MSRLTLNNGTVIEVLETSTPSSINIEGGLEAVSNDLKEITTETLKNADLAGTTLVNKIYTGFTGTRDGGTYTVAFSLRDKTENEIINERLDEQDAALMELADIVIG